MLITGRKKTCVALFGLLFLALGSLTGCARNPVTGRSELALVEMSAAEEVQLGKTAFQHALQRGGGAYPDRQLQQYVAAVGRRLALQSHRPDLEFRFALINDSSPNAFALPGGYIAVTRGLLTGLSNEAELAAVLGHEIAHVTARHGVQGMQRNALLSTAVGLLGGMADSSGYGGLISQAGGVAANLLDKRYSREQESESDRLGIDYMVKAGYDPAGAIQLQEYFYREVEQGADPRWLEGLFRSHPFSAQRLEENRRYVARHYPGVRGAGQDVLNFAREIGPLIQVRQGYATFDRARQLEQQGELAAAITAYHQALLEAPDEALILASLGLAYLRNEDIVPARRYLLKAVNRQPDWYQSRLGLGYIYLQKEQPAEAREQLEAGFDLLPTVQGGYMLAEAREQSGDLEGARELYTAVAKAEPTGKLGRRAALRLKQLGP